MNCFLDILTLSSVKFSTFNISYLIRMVIVHFSIALRLVTLATSSLNT